MALNDPTGGIGYAFGEVLTSTDMTTIATQQPRALDVVNGGTYSALAANISIDGSAARSFTLGANIAPITEGTIQANGGISVNAASVVGDGIDLTWSGTTNLPKIGSRSYKFVQPLTAVGNSNSRFTWDLNNFRWDQDDVADQGGLFFYLGHFPNKCTLDAVEVRVNGAGAGNTHTSLPSTMPTVRLRKYDMSGDTYSQVGSTATDASPNVAAYDQIHSINAAGLSEAIDGQGQSLYFLQFAGEGGANSVASALAFMGWQILVTCTEVAP